MTAGETPMPRASLSMTRVVFFSSAICGASGAVVRSPLANELGPGSSTTSVLTPHRAMSSM